MFGDLNIFRLAGTRWNCPLASSQITCMIYTCYCVYSLELLMMDGKTVRKTQSDIKKTRKLCASSWCYYRNISGCAVP